MTLIEFIKSQLSKDTQLGDLANDIKGDKEFPSDKTEEEIISYLDFKTRSGGTNSTFKRFLKAYKIQKDTEVDQLDLDTKFSLLRTENWKFYKENFPVDKVILIGQHSDFYKAYCIDTTNKKALYFDIKSDNSLDDISMVDEERIHIGNLTEQVSVNEAISLLEKCTYDTPVKPDKERFLELIEFLKANN
tara:strand:+ start:1035 stop:1604 length:570 start_codon:yes stop_codon:yes gene_type:complete